MVAALRTLWERHEPKVDGRPVSRVFRWQNRRAKAPNAVLRQSGYADRKCEARGQIYTAWRGAMQRAGIDRHLTPHHTRHTWSTWYLPTIAKGNPIMLKVEGGWANMNMLERYVRPIDPAMQEAILAFWRDGVESAGAADTTAAVGDI